MPRTWPDPWPKTEAEVRTWRIDNGFDFLLERLELPERLFNEHHASLDGITLTMVALSALAEYYGYYIAEQASPGSGDRKPPGEDKRRFRGLLAAFAPSFTNRISIIELGRGLRDASTGKLLNIAAAMREPMLDQFPVTKPPHTRYEEDDPEADAFKKWADGWARPLALTIPGMLYERYDYAGLLFDYYRNSVVHSLQVAAGREAYPDILDTGENPPLVFYANVRARSAVDYLDNIRLGFRPLSIFALAKEAIENARAWAHTVGVDIFRT